MNILVNGGSHGIGREVVTYYAKSEDNQIVATGRDEAALKELVSASKHGNVTYIVMDLARTDEQESQIKEQLCSRFSSLDIVINNAGILITGDFMKLTSDDARHLMEVNFIGPAALIRMVKPLLVKGSHIVNISSMGGYQGSSKYPGLSFYSASKAALSCLSECLAEEFKSDFISVNTLAIGSVGTSMFEKAFPGHSAPVKPEDMGAFIARFAESANIVINGKVIPVAVNNP